MQVDVGSEGKREGKRVREERKGQERDIYTTSSKGGAKALFVCPSEEMTNSNKERDIS